MNSDPARTRCPACEAETMHVFLELPEVPVHCNVLAETVAEARAVPRGDIRLGHCRGCGMIYNVSFDPGLPAYGAAYENSLHFSPSFRGYAEELAESLIQKYCAGGVQILEIGCGKGDFLALLSDGGRNRCIGFDSSYDDNQEHAGLHIIKSFFDVEEARRHPADLLACRHVLEHIDQPGPFLASVASVLAEEGAAYFEVPDGMYTLRDLGIWDIIYEHCSYFTAPAIERLFEAQGLSPTVIRSSFGGQFLCVEARRGGAPSTAIIEPPLDLAEVEAKVAAFGAEFTSKVEHWSRVLEERVAAGRRVAVWGVGSKGVTFLNTVRHGDAVHVAVDINERKRGGFVPGTAQRVVAPEDLRGEAMDTVLVMNPNYRDEIAAQLRDLDVEAEVLVV